MKKEEKKKAGAAGAAAAVVAAAGVAVAGMFGSPAEILEDDGKNSAYIDRAEAEEAAAAGDSEDTEDEEEKKRPGLKAAVSKKLLNLPVAVRALVLVPLWAIGTAILFAMGLVWPMLSPALGKVLGSVALAALVFGAIVLGAKALFPNMPIKKLLNRKTLPAICIAGSAAALLDLIIPLFISDYQNVRSVIQTIIMTSVSGAIIVFLSIILMRGKKKKESEPKPVQEPEIPKEITLEDAGGSFKIKTGK
ncbi:MAG: hypothetical protein IJS72_00595 [Oscillospiraceae bacterium]|nr:hypothetical protein [Oscillospiraceae bacterium]